MLFLHGCETAELVKLSLYGCGILGIRAELCSVIAVTGCEIYECSYGGISIGNSSGIKIEKCDFRDLGGDALNFYGCKDILVDGQQVSGNSRLSY